MDPNQALVITNKKEIAYTLNGVVAGKNLVHISGLYSRELLTSALLGVDYENELLYLDCSRNEATNRKLLSDRLIGCRSSLAGVRVEFPGIITGHLKFQGELAFVSVLPPTITKFQRRGYFRIPLGGIGAFCRIFGEGGPAGRVLDLSIGGLAAEFAARPGLEFRPGELYGHGVVDLPGMQKFNIDLMAKFTAQNSNNPPKIKVGFEFVGLPNGLLVELQKYVLIKERNV